MEQGANFFDHADIYGGGTCEERFGEAWTGAGIRREDMILQTKCGIRSREALPCYDQSKEWIIHSAEESMRRLRTDYLDVMLLHRPDALVEPEEVAEAFGILHASGKVRYFGVSNHRPMQIELLKTCVSQPLCVNQLQLSIAASNMIAGGMEVNMTSPGSADRDGSVLDYCRVNGITVQAWSPFQMPEWKGPMIGAAEYPELNRALEEIAGAHGVTPTAVAAAWITRHPAGMQVVAGTTNAERLAQVIAGSGVVLSRGEWYRLYLAAGHPLP